MSRTMKADEIRAFRDFHAGHRVRREEHAPPRPGSKHTAPSSRGKRESPKVQIVLYCEDCKATLVLDRVDYDAEEWNKPL